jgi:hypothetical protein
VHVCGATVDPSSPNGKVRNEPVDEAEIALTLKKRKSAGDVKQSSDRDLAKQTEHLFEKGAGNVPFHLTLSQSDRAPPSLQGDSVRIGRKSDPGSFSLVQTILMPVDFKAEREKYWKEHTGRAPKPSEEQPARRPQPSPTNATTPRPAAEGTTVEAPVFKSFDEFRSQSSTTPAKPSESTGLLAGLLGASTPKPPSRASSGTPASVAETPPGSQLSQNLPASPMPSPKKTGETDRVEAQLTALVKKVLKDKINTDGRGKGLELKWRKEGKSKSEFPASERKLRAEIVKRFLEKRGQDAAKYLRDHPGDVERYVAWCAEQYLDGRNI